MLKKTLPHFLITLLVGLFLGCASTNPYADEAQSNIQNNNFEAALEAAEEAITNHPDDALGYYYKAVALGEIGAEQEDPSARADYYERMNDTFEEAREVASKMESAPSEIENIPAIKGIIWRNEHNRAVELATDDSLKKTVEDPLGDAVNHLENATTVAPDSSLSWDVLSQVSAMNNDFSKAAQAKEKYFSMIPDTSITEQDHLQLAGFYYSEDNLDKVLEVLEKASDQYPESEEITSNLADTYMNTGHPEKSIATVEELVKQNPENPQYHLVLGTQIYQSALRLNDQISDNYDRIFELNQEARQASGGKAQEIKNELAELEQENQELEQEMNKLTDRAEEELNTVLEYRENDASAYNTLGVIYQNKAKALFDKRNNTLDNQKSAEFDKQAKEMLEEAMKNYQRAAEIEPDNQQYWEKLFSIYVALGMDEKAEEARKKAGIE